MKNYFRKSLKLYMDEDDVNDEEHMLFISGKDTNLKICFSF